MVQKPHNARWNQTRNEVYREEQKLLPLNHHCLQLEKVDSLFRATV